MVIETTKMSSRGQIVVPQDIRNEINAKEGSVFAIFGTDSTIILKKLETPTKDDVIKDLKKISKEFKKRAERLGIKESDIPNLVHKMRGIN